MTETEGRSKSREPFLVLFVWLAVLATAAASLFCWRMGFVRPHAFWAVLSIVSIVAPLVCLVVVTLRRIATGPARLRAIGWLLVGMTPLVWIGSYLTDISIRAETREPLAFSTPLRAIATWVSAVMDLEARWSYSRWTRGQHAVLMDAGQTPDAKRLVSAMDDHIRAMSNLLGQQVPNCEFPWVRGPLLGQNRRAVILWALCGIDDNPSELTHLDRHEVAHTLITALSGVDQSPPFLLIEGWAESQSVERDRLIEILAKRHLEGRAYTLQELVESPWYYTDSGPVYWEGGPLVIYLMEHYGPEKFFELYSGVRPSTFHADCQAILGDSWLAIEEAFWPWLEAENERISATIQEKPQPAEIKLADSVSASDWQHFLESYHSTRNNKAESLPTNAAFAAILTRTITDEKEGLSEDVTQFEFRALFEEGRFWITDNFSRQKNQYLKFTPEQRAALFGDGLGPFRGWVEGPKTTHDPREMAENLMHLYGQLNDPGELLPLNSSSERQGFFTITQLNRPESDGDWTLTFTGRNKKEVEGEKFEITLNPNLDWLIVSSRYANTENGPWISASEKSYQHLGDAMLPASVSVHYGVDDKNYVDSKIQWRALTPDEQQKLKQRVERVVAVGPAQPSSPYLWLRRCLLFACVACPAVGVLLLGTRKPTSSGLSHSTA